MKKNAFFSPALHVLQFARICAWIALIGLIGMGFTWSIDRTLFSNYYLVEGFSAGLTSFKLRISSTGLAFISLADISTGTFYWLLIRNILILVIVIYGLNLLAGILQSVRNLHTFYHNNISAFTRLTWLGLTAAAVAFFNFGTVNGSTQVNFTIPFGALIFSTFFVTLREVFKQGQELLKESEAII